MSDQTEHETSLDWLDDGRWRVSIRLRGVLRHESTHNTPGDATARAEQEVIRLQRLEGHDFGG